MLFIYYIFIYYSNFIEMDWKKDWPRLQITIRGDTHEIHQEQEIPQAEIRAFIARLIDKILTQKKQAGVLLPDSWPTHPENYDDFIELVQFSYHKIAEAWEHILRLHYIPIPFPKLRISENPTKDLHQFSWLCYMIHDEEIHVDPQLIEYFQKNIYAWTEDFSIFYALAHEFAHHIQKYLYAGLDIEYIHENQKHSRRVQDILDIRIFSIHHHFDSLHQAEKIVELHADYLAGVLVHHAARLNKPFLHENDIREWLLTALHVWDDMMQFRKTGTITPETFTHGRCDQRALAFATWLETGDFLAFSLREIADLFFVQGAAMPAHESVTMFKE